MKTKKLAAVLLAVIITVSLTAISAAAFDQPNMTAARDDLNKAENSLRNATADKGGHRNRALNLISQAIAEINSGIAFDRDTPRDRILPRDRVLPRGRRRNSHFDAGNVVSSSDQPNMQAAKNHLQDALNNLQRATADKGGHRAKAIDLTREAIAEVNKGIAFDRSN
jgi:predicted metal-dependent hydrolase